VREATGGEGVDVVLNALAGPFIPASLALLRPQGRFIEIGKRDLIAAPRSTSRRSCATSRSPRSTSARSSTRATRC
jgi:NADPH:quinone reductase-like Zn-dependent oxidoreductase